MPAFTESQIRPASVEGRRPISERARFVRLGGEGNHIAQREAAFHGNRYESMGPRAGSRAQGQDIVPWAERGDKGTLVTYFWMYGPQRERPCPMCTNWLGRSMATPPEGRGTDWYPKLIY